MAVKEDDKAWHEVQRTLTLSDHLELTGETIQSDNKRYNKNYDFKHYYLLIAHFFHYS